MKSQKTPCVLVCVTNQMSCDRLIKIGAETAKQLCVDLHVLSVRPVTANVALYSAEIDYLYQVAKEHKGEMTVIFNNRAPLTTAEFAKSCNAGCIITGMANDSIDAFIGMLHNYVPNIPILMVDKENLVHRLERVQAT